MSKHKSKKRRYISPVSRFFHRLALVVLTLAVLNAVGLAVMVRTILTGPSETARNELTVALNESAATKWVPGVFLDDTLVEQILRDAAGKEG
jgi:hypothetical protein